MPVIAAKPDGNQLFIAWCDRRDDPANSMIHVYGRFGSIDGSGNVTFPGSDFRITSCGFPPAFPGVLSTNKVNGHYDPVWAPGGVELEWYFGSEETDPPGWWPLDFGDPWLTPYTYAHEHGEHNGAFADEARVYLVWSDHRSDSLGTLYPARNQSDIRLARIPWPTP